MRDRTDLVGVCFMLACLFTTVYEIGREMP